MSAFVVDRKCMDRCVRTLTARGRYGQILRSFGGIDTAAAGAATEIGRRLFTLNVEAVMQRYPDTQDDPSRLPGDNMAPRHTSRYQAPQRGPSMLTRAELVDGAKALHCLVYQCAEGNVPESDLFRELEAAIGKICAQIVSNLPEYEAAAWG